MFKTPRLDLKGNYQLMTEEQYSTKKNLYSGVRGTAVKILNRIDRTDAYLDKLLENELINSDLKSTDKALLYELVHGIVRWSGRIDWILNSFYKGQLSKCAPNVKNSLRVALYQILFLNKIPDYAAVNEAVEFIKRVQGQKAADLTNAILRNIIRNKSSLRYPDPEEDLLEYLSSYYSHPQWMIKKWLQRFGREGTEALLEANNERPTLTLRVNTLKTDIEQVKSLLDSVGLKYESGKFFSDFLHLKSMTNITDWEYFSKGYFNIQDESTALSCRLLDVRPGMRVLDLCAAPGGKTSYIANLMNNEGEVVAIDKYESRLKILIKNMTRLGLRNIRAVEADALEFNDEEFDRVLLDAPCSGLGTLSKKPDIKWKRDLQDIRKLNSLQYELLEKGATLVKPGGVLVYSTCTIEPEENFEIVKKFIQKNTNFVISDSVNCFPDVLKDENGCIQSLPHIHRIDGAFSCKMERLK